MNVALQSSSLAPDYVFPLSIPPLSNSLLIPFAASPSEVDFLVRFNVTRFATGRISATEEGYNDGFTFDGLLIKLHE
jgi:hypothetical protein